MYKKLWKYARDVMEMEDDLRKDYGPDKAKQEHKFKLGMNRQASVVIETTDKPKKELESQPVWWLKKDESYQVLVEEEDGDDGFISYNSKQQQDASEISSV